MPHKFNASRRHKFDKAQYRVINWAEYNESLRQRGDLTIWVSEEAQSVWSAPRRTSRGGQWRYSDLAIETCLTLRTTYRLALRKRLEHRSRDEASRVYELSIWWWTVPASRSSARGNGSPRSIKSREYAADGANSTLGLRRWQTVRLFEPI